MNSPDLSLKQGDKIAVIAPAGKIDISDITGAIATLKNWGLRVCMGKHISNTHSVFAGTDKERAEDLQSALDNDRIKAILCARGGYGTIRTLEHINWEKFLSKPKLISGFSDITVIHSFLSRHNIPSLHSLMLINYKKATQTALKNLNQSLFCPPTHYRLMPEALNRLGKAQGKLTGGNVTILLSIMGTCYEPDYSGKILFIEDLGECHYHLDRIFQNFKQTIFPKIAGLIVGQFSDMRDSWKSFGKTPYEIIDEATKLFSFPTIYNFPAGHVPDNRSLWMNKTVYMDSNKEFAEIAQN